MKTSWSIEAGALRITVKDDRREQSWVIRRSQRQEVQANTFAEIAEALGMRAIVPPLRVPDVRVNEADLENAFQSRDWGTYEALLQEKETPERRKLRRQAEAALAGASAAKAIETGDEGSVAALPEVMGRESEDQVTSTAGFDTLGGASVAVDGTVYKTEDYRADKSNWVK